MPLKGISTDLGLVLGQREMVLIMVRSGVAESSRAPAAPDSGSDVRVCRRSMIQQSWPYDVWGFRRSLRPSRDHRSDRPSPISGSGEVSVASSTVRLGDG